MNVHKRYETYLVNIHRKIFGKSFCYDFNDEVIKSNLLFVVGWFGRIFYTVTYEGDTPLRRSGLTLYYLDVEVNTN